MGAPAKLNGLTTIIIISLSVTTPMDMSIGLSTRDDLVVHDEVAHDIVVHTKIGLAQPIPKLPWKPGEKEKHTIP